MADSAMAATTGCAPVRLDSKGRAVSTVRQSPI